MKAYITVGCSASGKSTWARGCSRDNQVIVIERDSIRMGILTSKIPSYRPFHDNMWQYWNFKWENEVTDIQMDKIKSAWSANLDIIISDTNLNITKRNELSKHLESIGYEVEIIVFGRDISMEELWKRDINRIDSVGFQTIAKQYQQFRQEFPRYNINKDVKDLDKCVLVDIDGTLTLGANNRSPFEWDKVDQDLPNHVVISAIRGLYRDGYKIIFMSGRDSVCRGKTIQWIDEVFGNSLRNDYDLFMRKQDDMRKDYIVKSELYFQHIDGKYSVEAVFDDRPQVVRNVWLEMGFKTLAVGNQYLEF